MTCPIFCVSNLLWLPRYVPVLLRVSQLCFIPHQFRRKPKEAKYPETIPFWAKRQHVVLPEAPEYLPVVCVKLCLSCMMCADGAAFPDDRHSSGRGAAASDSPRQETTASFCREIIGAYAD